MIHNNTPASVLNHLPITAWKLPRMERMRLESKLLQEHPSGELRFPEFLFRLGLLFLVFGLLGSVGPEKLRLVFIFASVVPSALITGALIFHWRRLGDWRMFTQKSLHLTFLLLLCYLFLVWLQPNVLAERVPNLYEGFQGLSREWIGVALPKIEGGPAGRWVGRLEATMELPLLMAGLCLVLSCYLILLLISTLCTGSRNLTGFYVICAFVVGVTLFLYPEPKVFIALGLLGFFLVVQWDQPMMLPETLLAQLLPCEENFLMRLKERGKLTAAEACRLLSGRADVAEEMLRSRLVEYDGSRNVLVSGVILQEEERSEEYQTIHKAVRIVRIGLLVLIMGVLSILYGVLPDPFLGPLDDILVLILGPSLPFLQVLRARRFARKP